MSPKTKLSRKKFDPRLRPVLVRVYKGLHDQVIGFGWRTAWSHDGGRRNFVACADMTKLTPEEKREKLNEYFRNYQKKRKENDPEYLEKTRKYQRKYQRELRKDPVFRAKRSAYSYEYRKSIKEDPVKHAKSLAQMRAYRKKRMEDPAWVKKNQDYMRDYHREYAKNHPEVIERAKEKQKWRYRNDPDYREEKKRQVREYRRNKRKTGSGARKS